MLLNKLIIVKMLLVMIFLSIFFSDSVYAFQQTETKNGETKSVAGIWLGTLEVNTVKLRIGLNITVKEDKTLSATLDSIDQGAKGLPIDTITYQETMVHFEAKQFGIVYDGKLNNGSEIVGTFKQGPGSFPLTFKRQEKELVINRPQNPQKPYPYDEQEVSYENKKDSIKLAGTLTLPHTKAPFPAVILITGSGPQDRDETILGHKPFLVLADYLTRQGIAVLRVDDRGVGATSKGSPTETSENYAEDVLAGVEFLKSRKEINPKQIGLMGHSEGGLIAPMAASKSTDVAFIVMLAGPGIPGDEILKLQGALIAKAAGVSDQAISITRQINEIIYRALREEKDNEIVKKRVTEEIKKFYGSLTPEEQQVIGDKKLSDEQINTLLKPITSSWFRFFLAYDPRPTLKKVKCPVLAVNGEKDLQVPYKENLAEVEKSLKESGNKDFKIQSFPNLNHLFQNCQTGSPSEYSQIEETFSPNALKVIGDWVVSKVTINK